MHNNVEIVNDTMRLLDSHEITFFILLDSKSTINVSEFILPHFSKLIFLPRENILWGHVSQVKAELKLLEYAYDYVKEEKSYFHLMSGADFSLLNSQEFLLFFKNAYPKEFVRFETSWRIPPERLDRVKYYYPTLNFNLPRLVSRILLVLSAKIQKVLKINRMNKSNFPNWTFQSGDQWFSITNNLAKIILDKKELILATFKNTRASDELFVQTILRSSILYNNISTRCEGSLRFIDWYRGHPYTFDDSDLEEILNARKEGFVFVRKLKVETSNKIRQRLLENSVKEDI